MIDGLHNSGNVNVDQKSTDDPQALMDLVALSNGPCDTVQELHRLIYCFVRLESSEMRSQRTRQRGMSRMKQFRSVFDHDARCSQVYGWRADRAGTGVSAGLVEEYDVGRT